MKTDNPDTTIAPEAGQSAMLLDATKHPPRHRRQWAWVAALAAATGVVATAAHFIPTAHAEPDEKPTSQPSEPEKPAGTAAVKTTPVRSGELSQPLVAYGSVTAQPGEIAVLSVPFESRVIHLRVTAGQAVDKDAELIDVEPSPEAKLVLKEAENAVQSTGKDLAQVQQRFDLKLATNTELATAQQAVQSAQVRLDSLNKNRGQDDSHRSLKSAAAGIVAKVDVQEGQLIAAGAPLVEVLPTGRIEVRLGVEPSQSNLVKAGQAVKLFPTAGATDGIAGTVRLVTRRVNPETRLVDVFVTPASDADLLLDSGVRGEFAGPATAGLIVPRNAVLPDDDGFTVFTVKDKTAVKHSVKLGTQTAAESLIVAADVHAGDSVVTVGALELEDKMAVDETRTGAKPATNGAGE